MPARIYALAKELNLDSKELVDIVKQVGITGKGSALASLTDSEAKKVRDHLSESAAPAASSSATATATRPAAKSTPPQTPVGAVRDSVTPQARKPLSIRVDRGRGKSPPAEESPAETTATASEEVAADVFVAEEAPAATDVAATAPPATEAVAEVSGDSASDASETDSADAAAQTPAAEVAAADRSSAADPPKPKADPAADIRSTTMASRIASRMASRKPSGSTTPNAPGAVRSGGAGGGKVRSLDAGSRGQRAKPTGEKPRKGPRLNVKMAALPTPADNKPAAPSKDEPKAQKPDVRLSKDAITGSKQGMGATLEQLERDEAERKRNEAASRRRGGGLSGFTSGKKEDDKPRRKGAAGLASARVDRGRGGRNRNFSLDGPPGLDRHHRRRTPKRKGVNTAAPRKEAVTLEMPATLRSFSEAAGVPVGRVLGTLMKMGVAGVNINSQLDYESAELIAAELDLEIQLKEAETLEDAVISELEAIEDDADSLRLRAPIVTFLGHVDHGKTSLLDHLIGTNVVSGEAGGITQHIRAYEVEKDEKTVTFVDTPGHEAFTEMRARGANVTDIAVLVIAADDGIMPQTEEAISHAKAAEVPIVVALNKIDLDGVDPNRVLTQMTEHGLTPSEWGGDVEVVRTSAIKGTGMDELLETLLTIAELNEYVANPDREAIGVCLESNQDGDRGVSAKLIVQTGTLKIGDIIVCGPAHGRVRAMYDTLSGEPLTEAGPSTPATVMGLDTPPGAGDRFHVLQDIGKAREIAGTRADEAARGNLSGVTTKVSFDNFQALLESGNLGKTEEKVRLNMIIRADAKGSLEAIDKELSKIDHPEVEIKVLQRSVGGVTLADVTLASASDAVIAAFNVVPDEQARTLADQRNVEIRRYDVIYKLTDEIKALLEGRLKPEEKVIELGRAVVRKVFNISKAGTVAGCYVASGTIQRNARMRVNRDGRTIGDYPIDTLKRIKEDVREVPSGMECGIKLSGFNDVKPDDLLEAYKVEEVARTLD